MTQLQLVPVGAINPAVVQWLSVALSDSLQLHCSVRTEAVDPGVAYHPGRLQYNSTRILTSLAGIKCDQGTKILGIAAVDLFIPILTFVFGEAQLGKSAALMSIHRLHQSFYGLPEDETLLYTRCEKEAIHELGHSFGLIHCRQFDCVMHFSNSIEQVDLKNNAFCEDCSKQFATSQMGNGF